jgi:hypothetical protein
MGFWEDQPETGPRRQRFTKPGDYIAGILTHLERVNLAPQGEDQRLVLVLFISDDGETDTEVRCPSSLERLLTEIKPEKDDHIKITFTSETPLRGPGNRTEMHWRVVHGGQTYSS